ncbi:MAG: ABC transporter permease [Chloroflexota bacterium]|nr:MAG: ABC transporter permease [Chloroflexota bacterium]
MLIRLVKEKPLGTIGGIIVLLLLIVGVFAGLMAPYGYNDIYVGPRLSAPSPENLLGCDQLGRDLLSRIIYGARISLIVGLSVSAIAVILSTAIGFVSGYFGGKIDMVIQRFVDAWLSIPPLFLILALIAVAGPGMLQVILVLGILFGIGQSRIVRGAVIGIRANTYLEAATAIGCGTGRILWKHVFPNVTAPIIVLFTITLGAAVLAEATISFLGFGIPPPMPSWGGMLSEAGRRYMLMAPHLALWPGLFLAVVVYGINMLGDAFRDLVDPRLRGGLGRYDRARKMIAKASTNQAGEVMDEQLKNKK